MSAQIALLGAVKIHVTRQGCVPRSHLSSNIESGMIGALSRDIERCNDSEWVLSSRVFQLAKWATSREQGVFFGSQETPVTVEVSRLA